MSCTLTVLGCHICHFSTLPLIYHSASLPLLLEACSPLEKHILFEVLLNLWTSLSEILLPHRLYVSEVIPLVKDGEMEVPLWPPNLAVGWRACGAARNDAWCLQHLQILTAFSSMMRTKSLTSTLMPVWGEVLGCALELCSKKENSVAGKKPTLFLANAAAVVLFPSEERAVHQGNFTLLPRGADKSSMSRHFLLLYLAGLWDWE